MGLMINYADYPDNFMLRLEAGQKYILKNGESLRDFCAESTVAEKSNRILQYGEYVIDISGAVHYGYTEPVLIHYNDKDYVWICNHNNNNLPGAYVYRVTDNGLSGGDNCIINISGFDRVLDPNDYEAACVKECFGIALSRVRYRVGETGKPEEIETCDRFYGIEEHYRKQLFRLDTDIHTWVYANAEAEACTEADIPAGTGFHRFRIPRASEHGYVDGILEDGRVFRVIEVKRFSEPNSYYEMRDMNNHKFTYSVVKDGEKACF